jgi:thiol:disulfide interchange protein
MNKQRSIGFGLLCCLALGGIGAIASGQDVQPASGSEAENPPLLIPGLKDEAGAPRKPTIAEALGFSAEDQETGDVEATAQFTLEKGTRKGVLSLTGTITPGWHIYSVTQQKGATRPTKIKVEESPAFKIVGPFQPDQAPHIKHEKIYRVPLEEHEGTVTWTAPIELAEGVDPESLTIPVEIRGQICKQSCMDYDATAEATFAGYTAAAAGEYRPDPREAEVVFRGHLEPAVVAPGGKAKLVITAEPTPGHHLYAYAIVDPDQVAKPTLIHLMPLPGWTRSAVIASVEPKLEPSQDPKFPDAYVHEEPVTWTIDLTAPADSKDGEYVVSGYIGYQTCKNGGGCLRPTMVQFRASLPVKAKAEEGQIPLAFTGPSTEQSRSPVSAGSEVKSYRDVARLAAANPAPTGEIDFASLGMYVGFGLLGGLILNLMPCVLPVIGLKVLSFVQQGGQSRGRIFALNLWFAAGLLLVFLALATFAAFANVGWGQQFTYTWFKVAMVVLVFAFALSFLGVWEVPIPGFAQSNSSSKLQKQEGATGAFFKGIFTTLLATPCSGPFLGPVFGFTLTQPPVVTYILFASVGLGMALPYILIGAFPALVKWLPKPGEWMETFKQVMGFVLLGTVVYLFSTINSDYFIPTLALVIGVWFACWWIGKVPIYEDTSKQVWAWVGGCAAAGLIGYASFTFLGPVKHLYEWEAYTPDRIAALQTEGKTVMVDFTADWCLTCQWNFKSAINTHRMKEVVEKNQIVPMLADWTDESEMIKERLAELNSKSIPLLAIYPAGKPGEVIVLRDVITEKQLVTALAEAGALKETESATAAVKGPDANHSPVAAR